MIPRLEDIARVIGRLEDIAGVIGRHRYRYESEIQLQGQLAVVLAAAGVPFDREVSLGKGERIDFLSAEPYGLNIGIEVKVLGSRAAVARQLFRYAGYSDISALILVTDRTQLALMPSVIRGVPVEVVNLMSGLR